jgi:hypothetical protein
MNLFDGLHFYEIVLLVLGVLFFIVLLFVLVYSVIKKQAIKNLLPFFIIPIIMIGYPSIQEVKIANGMLNIEKLTDEVKGNPNNVEARAALAEKLSKLERREIKNPDSLIEMAKAQAAINNKAKARTHINSVLKVRPDSREALELQLMIEGP